MENLSIGVGQKRDSLAAQDRFVTTDGDLALGVNDNVCHVTGFDAAVAITLPQVADAAGRVFAIKILDAADVNNVTVQDNDESRSWTDLTCSNASGGKVVLFSDGEEWHVIASTNVS